MSRQLRDGNCFQIAATFSTRFGVDDEGEEEEGKFERKAVTVSALIRKAPFGR